jgi:hypothetical protein
VTSSFNSNAPELTGVVADIDDTTPGKPGHPALALIIERSDDLARIVMRDALKGTWDSKKSPSLSRC